MLKKARIGRFPASGPSIGILLILGLAVFAGAQESGTAGTAAKDPLTFSLTPLQAPAGSSVSGLELRSPLSDLHAGLGFATVAVGLATGLLNPETAGRNVHETLGYTSAGMAAATMLFGFLAHYRDIDSGSGLNSNNIHVLLGIAGGTMMIITPFLAPSDTHKALGELGALTMGLSVGWKILY